MKKRTNNVDSSTSYENEEDYTSEESNSTQQEGFDYFSDGASDWSEDEISFEESVYNDFLKDDPPYSNSSSYLEESINKTSDTKESDGNEGILELICKNGKVNQVKTFLKNFSKQDKYLLLQNSEALELANSVEIIEVLLSGLDKNQIMKLLHENREESLFNRNEKISEFIDSLPIDKKNKELSFIDFSDESGADLKSYKEFFKSLPIKKKMELLQNNDWLYMAVLHKDIELINAMMQGLGNKDKGDLLFQKPLHKDAKTPIASINSQAIMASLLDSYNWNDLNRLLCPEKFSQAVQVTEINGFKEYEEKRLKQELEKIKNKEKSNNNKEYFLNLRSDYKYEFLKNNKEWLTTAKEANNKSLVNAMLDGLPQDQRNSLLSKNKTKDINDFSKTNTISESNDKLLFTPLEQSDEIKYSFKDFEEKVKSNKELKTYEDFFRLLEPEDKKKFLKENDWLTLAIETNNKNLVDAIFENFNTQEQIELLKQAPLNPNYCRPITAIKDINIIDSGNGIDIIEDSKNKNELDIYKEYFSNMRTDIKYEFLTNNSKWLRAAARSNNLELIDSMLEGIPRDQKANILKKAKALSYATNKEAFNLLWKDLNIDNKFYLLTADKNDNDRMSYPLDNALGLKRLDIAKTILKDDLIKREKLIKLLEDPKVKTEEITGYFEFLKKDERRALISRKGRESEKREDKIKFSLLLELEKRPKLREMLAEYRFNQPQFGEEHENKELSKTFLNRIGNIFAKFVPGRDTDLELFNKITSISDNKFLLEAATAIEKRSYDKEIEKRPKLKKLLAKKDGELEEILTTKNKLGNSLRETDMKLLKKIIAATDNKMLLGKIKDYEDEAKIAKRPKLKKLLANPEKSKEILSIKNKLGNYLAEFVPGRESDMQVFRRIESKRKKREIYKD